MLNRPIYAAGRPFPMEAAAEAAFLTWTDRFFIDGSSPSPLSLSLHPCLAKEWALPIALTNGSSLEAFSSRELAGGAWAAACCGGREAAVLGVGGSAAAAP